MPALQSKTRKSVTAGSIPRLVAFWLDLLVFGLVWLIIRAFLKKIIPDPQAPVFFHYTALALCFYLLRSLWLSVFLAGNGTTPGKALMGLRVIMKNGDKIKFWQAFYRETVGRYVGSFAMIGYFFILFQKEHRSLQDLIADTRVVFSGVDPALFADEPEAAAREEEHHETVPVAETVSNEEETPEFQEEIVENEEITEPEETTESEETTDSVL